MSGYENNERGSGFTEMREMCGLPFRPWLLRSGKFDLFNMYLNKIIPLREHVTKLTILNNK